MYLSEWNMDELQSTRSFQVVQLILIPFWKMRYLTYTAIQKYFLFLFKEINTFIQDVEYKI